MPHLRLRLFKTVEIDASGTLAVIVAGILAALLLHLIPA